MKNRFILSWALANAIGMSVGFLAFIQFLQFYRFILDFKLHWDFKAAQNLDRSTDFVVLGISMGLPLFGAISSAAQGIILNRFLPKIGYWVLNGALGYLMVVLIIFPFGNTWGHIEGPVEPLTIVFGGTLFTLI